MGEHHWAGIIIFLLGFYGFTCNTTVILFLRKAKTLANPFRILTVNQAVTDLINSSVFAFIIAPTVFFTFALPFEVTTRLGQLLFLAYDCCSWSHLMITLNRFTFTFFPISYPDVFTRTRTLTSVVSIWIVAICINFYEYVLIDCHFYLPVGAWNFDFKGGSACKNVEWYLNYCRNMVLTACIVFIDVITIIKFHSYSRADEVTSGQSKWKMQKQEVLLLTQAMLQSSLFYVELVCCYNIGALPFMASPWAQFGLRTVAWVTTHAADGLITLMCNGDFRRMLYRRLFSNSKVKMMPSSKSALTLSINFNDGRGSPARPNTTNRRPSRTA